MNQNELYHYGVLGMKWGTHRVKVNAMKADKARKAGNMALAKKHQARSDYLRTKHTTRGGGKKVYDKVSKTGTGKLLLESAPFSTYGALNYNRMRAHGKSRALSGGGGVATRIASNMLGMLPSIVEPRLTSYDISDRNKNKKYLDIRKAKRDYKQAKLEYKQAKKAKKRYKQTKRNVYA